VDVKALADLVPGIDEHPALRRRAEDAGRQVTEEDEKGKGPLGAG
jgi:hypothetical protein